MSAANDAPALSVTSVIAANSDFMIGSVQFDAHSIIGIAGFTCHRQATVGPKKEDLQ
jgi:hypothetical protein